MNNKNTIIFALTLILIGVIIAGGIIFGHKKSVKIDEASVEKVEYTITPISDDDHILGNPDADIILVEYADFLCSYCHEFHLTMKQLMNDFGKTGNLAWVYRHFPREDAFANKNSISIIAAQASECVADIGGKQKFWDFIGKIYDDLPITFDQTDLETIALALDIDKEKYTECLASGKFNEKIQKSIDDGLMIYSHDSSFGTPYSILLTKTGKQIEIVGSQSYNYIKEIIKQYSALRDTI
jgi:protein-disulfide isomerase